MKSWGRARGPRRFFARRRGWRRYVLRYAGDDVDDVRLISEALVCELIAQRAWELKVAVG